VEINNPVIFSEVETENLVLRPISLTDREFILQQFSDPDVCRFFVDEEPLSNIKEAETLINWYTVPEPRNRHRWIIFRKMDGIPIGTCGYHIWDIKNHICEIGYDLAYNYWGKGYMTEALRRAIVFGFEIMDLNRIQAFVHTENIRSINLLKKFNFTQEGIFRDKHLYRGNYYDHLFFSLLRRECKR
jgi:[ribosomal protein S5]-alanine N-acetyltransferase